MDIRKYITERLDAGDNMETILNGIADVANAMSAEMVQNSVKASRAQEVVDIVGAFMSDFYPDAIPASKSVEFTGEDLIAALDELAPVLKSTRELMESLEALGVPHKAKEMPEIKKIAVKVPANADPDAVIQDFLKNLGV